MGEVTSRLWCEDSADFSVAPFPRDAKHELRWAVNIGNWRPCDAEWRLLLDELPAGEQAAVARFRFPVDQRRALVSRLLQRRCICEALDITPEHVVIERTNGNKPFASALCGRTVEAARARASAPNFNFNVSHEGDYVVLAAEPVLLVGVDVSAPFELRNGAQFGETLAELRRVFGTSLSDDEWDAIATLPTEEQRVFAFRLQWSRKEAFVKARGDGLGFDLKRVEFNSCSAPRFCGARDGPAAETAQDCAAAWDTSQAVCARVYVDGTLRRDALCASEQLAANHVASVVRLPPSAAQDAAGAFRETFARPSLDKGELQARLAAPPPRFEHKQLEDLLAPHKRAELRRTRRARDDSSS